MNWNWLKRWPAVVGAIGAIIAGAAAATGEAQKVVDGVRSLGNLSSRSYVDGEVGKVRTQLAGDLDPIARQLSTLSRVVAGSVIRGLEADVESLDVKVIAKQSTIESMPVGSPLLLGLRAELRSLERQREQKAAELEAALCDRVNLISNRDAGCAK